MIKKIVVKTIHEGDCENTLSGEFIELVTDEPTYFAVVMADGKRHAIPHRIITKIITWKE